MVEEIVLHIGPPKTGSTTIQKALFRNAQALEDAGIFVPRQQNATCILLAAGRGREIQRNDEEQYLLLKDIIETGGRPRYGARISKVVVSCEFLSGMSVEELKRVGRFLRLDACRARVVMYLRDPGELYRARVQELLKKGHSYRKSSDQLGHRNRTVYTKLTAAFRDMVIARPFQSACPAWDVVSDFELVAGVGSIASPARDRDNISMSLQAGIIFDALSKQSFDVKKFRGIRERVLKVPGDRFEVDARDYARWSGELRGDANWCNLVHGTKFVIDDEGGVDWCSRVEETLAREDVADMIREYDLNM